MKILLKQMLFKI